MESGSLRPAGAVHSATPAGERYVLLMNADGHYLSAVGAAGVLTISPHASDEACWLLRTVHSVGHATPVARPPTKKWMRMRDAKAASSMPKAPTWSAAIGQISFCHPPTGVILQPSPAQASSPRASSEGLLSIPGIGEAVNLTVGSDCSTHGDGRSTTTFWLVHGPDRLPSEYLSQMRENGYCAMPSLIAPSTLAELRRMYGLDGNLLDQGQQAAACSTVSVKVLTHPVVSWIAHQYMRTSELRVGAGPSLVTLQPGQNAEGRGGWHCDYPYAASHTFSTEYPYLPWGRYPDPGDADDTEPGSLGLLYNVCVDEFTARNGATMFALGSASEHTAPPKEWEGLSMLEEVPAGGPSGVGVDRKAEQLVAPAGTAILYDCRTWHRQHANMSDEARSCLLTIFTPRWILPAHGDQTAMRAAMSSATGVTTRERESVNHLLGDSNAARENWPLVMPIIPDTLESGEEASGEERSAGASGHRKSCKL